jgi:hypothetical protein
MKRGIWGRALVAVAALCLVTSVSVAASMGKDPVVGNWELDPASSSMNGQNAFKSGHVSITVTKGVYKSVVDLAPASGAAIHYESSYKQDGMDVPVTGNTYFDSATLVRIDHSTTIRTERRGGKVVGVTTIEVSKDGKTLSSSSKGTSADGKQFVRALSWHRAKK